MYQHLITLTTCSEIFHTDNRMIAFGHLIEVRDKEVLSKSPTGAAAKS
jgi:sortase A